MVDKDKIFEKVKALVVKELDVTEDEVTLKTSFTDLGADSLDVVELVMLLEEEFSMTISDDEAEKLTTMEKTVDYIFQDVCRPS